MSFTTVAGNQCFGGQQLVVAHQSAITGTSMRVGLFLPSAANDGPVPVVMWLSGLTCTEENFIVKAGAQRVAQELGIAIIAPDTSPRGLNHPGEDDAYDFGSGAGFYVDATEQPWANGYQMYSYVLGLPALLANEFPIDTQRMGITGHSMGGHGALTIALKNPDQFRSVSAFAPICSPMNCAWGEKALTGYLGKDTGQWAQYDACELVKSEGWKGKILVEQGEADNFLVDQLKPELLEAAEAAFQVQVQINRRPGYDHSYFFIASYIEDHLRFLCDGVRS